MFYLQMFSSNNNISGSFEKEIIKKSPKKKDFFNKDNKLKGKIIKKFNLEYYIKDEKILNFIKLCLVIDFEKRIDIENLLKYYKDNF